MAWDERAAHRFHSGQFGETQGFLAKEEYPLAVVTAEERGQKVDKVLKFVKDHDISHIYANLEYEVDELRRDIKLAKKVQDEEDLFSTLR